MKNLNEKWVIVREVNGRQILFFKDIDDDGKPAITTKVQTVVGVTSMTGTVKSEDSLDIEFNKIYKKPDNLIEGMFDAIDKMIEQGADAY